MIPTDSNISLFRCPFVNAFFRPLSFSGRLEAQLTLRVGARATAKRTAVASPIVGILSFVAGDLVSFLVTETGGLLLHSSERHFVPFIVFSSIRQNFHFRDIR